MTCKISGGRWQCIFGASSKRSTTNTSVVTTRSDDRDGALPEGEGRFPRLSPKLANFGGLRWTREAIW